MQYSRGLTDQNHVGKYLSGKDLKNSSLTNKELINCDFSAARLYKSDFDDCRFQDCTFDTTDLTRARLESCVFERCTFNGSNLNDCSFYSSSFWECSFTKSTGIHACFDSIVSSFLNFEGVYLTQSSFRNAQLHGAIFAAANLSQTTLFRSILARADFTGAQVPAWGLTETDLLGVKGLDPLVAAQLSILPAGTLIVYKKLACRFIAQLEIPARAIRHNATGRKCRASEAKVLAIWDDAGKSVQEGASIRDPGFYYKVGQTVRPREGLVAPLDGLIGSRWKECDQGIHFFLTIEEAENFEF